ncbi:MAG TPA: hypothetical protein VM531_11270 [Sphingomicrobium sp.]|jgi:hypothetical protein|nr:hypothetical protein [Sphingomicrobium sp.]
MPEELVTYAAKFKIGQRVHVDTDASIVAVVTGVLFREVRHEVEIAWFCNGSNYSAWVPEFRLSKAK